MTTKWMTRLSNALGLKEYSQDWGVCNADADRLLEFIDYFERYQAQDPEEPEALAELIIASFNDGLVEETVTEVDIVAFRAFVALNQGSFPEQFTHWCELDDDDDFPVGPILRETEAS